MRFTARSCQSAADRGDRERDFLLVAFGQAQCLFPASCDDLLGQLRRAIVVTLHRGGDRSLSREAQDRGKPVRPLQCKAGSRFTPSREVEDRCGRHTDHDVIRDDGTRFRRIRSSRDQAKQRSQTDALTRFTKTASLEITKSIAAKRPSPSRASSRRSNDAALR